MDKQRIAIIIYGGIGVGIGLEGVVCLVELCERIAEDYDLTVFSMVRVNKNYQPKGYKLIGVPFSHKRNVIFRIIYISFKIIQQHFKNRYSLIHAFWAYPAGLLALGLGKLFGLKTIITFMGGEIADIPSINYGLYRSKFKKRAIQFIAKNVDVVVALTQHHARSLKEKLFYRRMETIAFGVNLTKYPRTKKQLIPPYQFLYLGNMNSVKDLPTLVKTFQKISQIVDSRLDIVGLDTLNGKIQALVSELNLVDKITFHGYQLNSQLSSFLEKAHILLHTSRWESQAVVVNEALASGVVVCGTRVGIIDDLEDTVTTCVAVGDAEMLSQKVINLLNNIEMYEQFRINGIAWSEDNDLETQYQKYNRLYQNLLGK
jgi:glycosyltransferase involved in cell wall biosynthesis